jgi:hypothetical protein
LHREELAPLRGLLQDLGEGLVGLGDLPASSKAVAEYSAILVGIVGVHAR